MDVLRACLGFPKQDVFESVNVTDLPLNHAYIMANTGMDEVGVYTLADDCIGCPYSLRQRLHSGLNHSWAVDAGVPSTWRLMNTAHADTLTARSGLICQFRPTLGEYGVYRLDIGECNLVPALDPINIYLPLVFWCLLLAAGYGLATGARVMLNRRRSAEDPEQGDEKSIKPTVEVVKMPTLYVVRGLLLSTIIFLTTGGGGYTVVTRDWFGYTLAECLFYAYVWTVGVKIPTTVDQAYALGYTKCNVFTDILKRSFCLILIGTVINSTVASELTADTQGLWWPLQRMGIAYLVTATAYAVTVQKFEMDSKSILCKAIANVVSLIWCWIITGFLFAVQVIAISTFLSFNCESNLGLKNPTLDLEITDKSNSCTRHYEMTRLVNQVFMATPTTIIFVNSYYGFSKGFLGILGTIIQCMMGLKAGAVYRHHSDHGDRLMLWGIWATLFAAGGVVIAGLAVPFQFNLWPLSTLILLSTTAMLIFVILYVAVEYMKIIELNVLRSIGMTSLVVLSGHVLFSKSFPLNFGNLVTFRTHFEMLFQNIWIVSLWLVIGVLLMKKRVQFSI